MTELYTGPDDSRTVVIPSSVRTICHAALSLYYVKRVIFPKSSQLREIQNGAFANCALTSFTAPASLRVLAQRALAFCPYLRRVELNEGLEILGTPEWAGGVFQGSVLEEIVLPSTLKRIARAAFCQCKNLKHIRLPEGLRYIEKECFAGSGLSEIRLPATLQEIEDEPDIFCRQFTRIYVEPGNSVGAELRALFPNKVVVHSALDADQKLRILERLD